VWVGNGGLERAWTGRGTRSLAWSLLYLGRLFFELAGLPSEGLLIRLDPDRRKFEAGPAPSAFTRQSYSAAFGDGSGTTLAPLLPSMMAAILSAVRLATARSGSSFKWA
jgi:hypothetical protein